MIKYDYEFTREEGVRTKTYKPDKIPTELPNLCYIEAPNSSGKSNLLNLIALCFYGQKKSSITKELRKKIKDLVNSDYQKLSFEINIDDERNNYQIEVIKEDSNVRDYKVYEIKDGEKNIMTPEMIENKFNIIYDIPNNPIARLKQLTSEIEELQIKYGNKVATLRSKINTILSEIKKSKDPNQINKFKEHVKQINKESKEKEKEIKTKGKNIENLELYIHWRFKKEYESELKTIKQNLNTAEKRYNKQRNKVKKSNKKFYKELDFAKLKIRDLNKNYDSLTKILRSVMSSKENARLELWEKINLNNTIEDLRFPEHFQELLHKFKNKIKKIRSKISNNKESKELDLYKQLLEVLSDHQGTNMEIPGIKSIDSFIANLTKKVHNGESLLKRKENLDAALEKIDKIKKTKKGLDEVFKELRELKPTLKVEEKKLLNQESVQTEVEDLRKKFKELKKKFTFYHANYQSDGALKERQIKSRLKERFSDYEAYREKQLKDELKRERKDTSTLKEKFEDQKSRIKRMKDQITNMEQKKEHPYKQYEKQLIKLEKITKKLDYKLRQKFSDFIIDLKEGKRKNDDDYLAYAKKVFSYLGKRIGKIRHIDETLKINKVDLFKNAAYSDKGVIIQLDDMGTGQSQSAYLKGLLNTSDKRSMIILFDEVGMMDKNSLRPVINKIKKLEESGKVLLSIIVQKAETSRVMSFKKWL